MPTYLCIQIGFNRKREHAEAHGQVVRSEGVPQAGLTHSIRSKRWLYSAGGRKDMPSGKMYARLMPKGGRPNYLDHGFSYCLCLTFLAISTTLFAIRSLLHACHHRGVPCIFRRFSLQNLCAAPNYGSLQTWMGTTRHVVRQGSHVRLTLALLRN